MIGLKTRRNFLQSGKASQEQPRANEQQHRQGNFHGDQRAAKDMLAGPGRRATRALIKRPAQIQICRAECGHDAEEQSGEQRNYRSKSQDPRIQSNRRALRDAVTRNLRQESNCSQCDDYAEQAACQGKKNALGEKLPNNPATARAHRRADGDFPAARGCPGQQEVGDIGAGDQKNKTHGAKEE